MRRRAGWLRTVATAALALGLGALPPLPLAGNSIEPGEEKQVESPDATRRPGKPLPAIRAVVRPRHVRPGDLVTVEVVGRRLRNIGAVAFHLVFDPSLLEPVPEGFTEGPLLRRGGARTVFLARPASTGDRILLGVTRLGAPQGARGDGTLCRLTFRALEPGATSVVFDRARITRPDARERRARFVPGRIVIRDAAKAGRRR